MNASANTPDNPDNPDTSTAPEMTTPETANPTTDTTPAAEMAAAPIAAPISEAPEAPETTGETNTPTQPEQDSEQAFAALGLGRQALRAIAALGYGEPTPIQRQTIPQLLEGRDVIAQAPTGTGKTAAYGLPIVEHLQENELKPQALIIVPTRELAIQVAEALHDLGKYRELVTLPIYGGQPYERQFRALARGVQVIVGTPGRLLDHLNRKTLDLSTVRTVILDEADEMLDMGFIEDIEAILTQAPADRQTALFSATIPPRIARLAQQYQRNPERVSVATREAVAPLVRQVYYETPFSAKPDALARILDAEEPDSAIIFVRTRRDADEVAERLNGMGYLAQAIHGEINQSQRERALERFRNGHTQLLVATDVAARGLDIPDVSHIINYDLPLDAESYVHRIGRTGRAGQTGEALTLVTPRERRQLQFIERAIHRQLERLRLPSIADVAARRRAAFREDLLGILDHGQLDPFLALVEDLADTRDPAELAAAAFKMAAQAREASRPGHGGAGAWYEATGGRAPQPDIADMLDAQERAARGPRDRWDGRDGRDERDERAGGHEHPRRERGDRRSAFGNGPMARLFLRVGKRDGVRPADLVGTIANEAGIPGDAIGDIDLYDTFSFVEAPEAEAQAVVDALNRTTIRGRPPRASLARPDGAWPTDGAKAAAAESDDRDAAPRRNRPWDRPRDRDNDYSFGNSSFGGDRRSPGRSGPPHRGATTGPLGARKGTGRAFSDRRARDERRQDRPDRSASRKRG
ncbi:MAG: DEAD/DEAH box helicase [Ktedonobacterales bacterium]